MDTWYTCGPFKPQAEECYDRKDSSKHSKRYNLPSLASVNLLHLALFKGMLQLT